MNEYMSERIYERQFVRKHNINKNMYLFNMRFLMCEYFNKKKWESIKLKNK